MAIVHISTKAISRKAGQSAVASAAYRAGVTLKDERYDKSHDYLKKSGVMSADIILPSALKAKGMMVSREEIWNKAEAVEGRTDSRVAREWLINLPHELDEAKRKLLAHKFAQALADKYNIITDCAIHSPSQREIARGADPRNYHAHILVTTREAKMGADGELFFDKQLKIPFEWSNKKRDTKGLQSSIKEIKDIRQLWVDMANQALAELDVIPLDARSFKAQGVDRLPTVKMGVDATNMERKGTNTENGNKNRAISVINQRKAFTKQSNRKAADERHTNEYTEWAADRIEWTNNRHQQIVKRIDDNQQRVERSQRDTEWAVGEDKTISKVIEQSSKRGERNSNTAQRNSDNAEWATRRGERILKIAGTSEPNVAAREKRVARYQRQASDVNRIIDERTNKSAAPSPFDDNARRARATRLAKQQRRDDEQQRRNDTDARRNHYEDERRAKSVGYLKITMAVILLSRHHENHVLQPIWDETSEQYPKKFDERQIKCLDEFAQIIGADEKITDFHEDSRRIAQLFTADIVEKYKDIIQLLRDPEKERERFSNIISSETHANALQPSLNTLSEHDSNHISNDPQKALQEDIDTTKQSNTRRFKR